MEENTDYGVSPCGLVHMKEIQVVLSSLATYIIRRIHEIRGEIH